jgi:hypothetical protein
VNLSLSLTNNLGLTGGASVFSPLSLSPAAWYDPSDLTTLWKDTAGTVPVTADGDIVLRMDDKSGNGRNMTVAVNGPVYKDQSGLKYLLFDGTNDQLVSAAISVSSPFIRSTGLKQVSWTGSDVIWDMRAGGGSQGFLLGQFGSTPALQMYDGGFGATTNGAAIGVSAVVRELWTPASGTSITINNGTPVTNALNSSGTSNGWTLGTDTNSANASNVQFFGAVFLTGTTPNSQVDTYLGAKGGIVI